MRHRISTACLTGLILGAAVGVATAQTPVPVLEKTDPVVSLMRLNPEWRVVTTIVLSIKAQDVAKPVVFTHSPPAKGNLVCEGENANHESTVTDRRAVTCSFEPFVNMRGEDAFTFKARFEGGADSAAETVTIDIRDRGLRWEFRTNASTITSDGAGAGDLANIPKVLGATNQDFLFTLNMQQVRPSRRLTPSAAKRLTAALPPVRSDLLVEPSRRSSATNFVFETGIVSQPVVADVADASSATGGASAAASQSAVAKRMLVMRGEFNASTTSHADGAGGFVEIGVVGRGGLDVLVQQDESFVKAASRVLRVVPRKDVSKRVEGGVRFALKQRAEDTTTLVTNGKVVEAPSNIDDFVVAEWTFRYDEALEGLPTDSAGLDSRYRWAARVLFFPQVKGLPGYQRFFLGAEISKAWRGGPETVKVLYGINLTNARGLL